MDAKKRTYFKKQNDHKFTNKQKYEANLPVAFPRD